MYIRYFLNKRCRNVKTVSLDSLILSYSFFFTFIEFYMCISHDYNKAFFNVLLVSVIQYQWPLYEAIFTLIMFPNQG